MRFAGAPKRQTGLSGHSNQPESLYRSLPTFGFERFLLVARLRVRHEGMISGLCESELSRGGV